MSDISFIYLSTFSTQGGIEKFNRALLKAFSENKTLVSVYSLYDHKNDIDNRYIGGNNFFSGKKSNKLFSLCSIFFDQLFNRRGPILLGHINLAPLAILINLLQPNRRMILIAHGIDVWNKLTWSKKKLLKCADEVWAVSNYTRNRLLSDYPRLDGKIKIFPNTLDPYFPILKPSTKSSRLIKKYNIKEEEKIILTIARISSSEKYKGYDRVVEALANLEDKSCRYFVGGRYDESEKQRVLKIAKKFGIENRVSFLGYIGEEELIEHFRLADLFIMPSLQEGFGIVFIEALACGTPVVGGNMDGSVDALDNGRLGTLINPMDIKSMACSIKQHLKDPENKNFERQKTRIKNVHATFGFSEFRKRLVTRLTHN